MPFVLIFVGIVVLVAAVRGNEQQLGHLLAGDFFGPGSFFWWLIAIGVLGMVGYIPGAKKWSVAFMTLVLIAFIVKSPTIFSQAIAEVTQGTTQAGNTANQDVGQGWDTLVANSGGGAAGLLGSASQAVGAVSSAATFVSGL